ncbi:MAG: Ni/Fe-hydrogenase, b-type cytochrome subunit, partial [Campylobacter sp.]|nr:Ni/Fe-hydrogenase, b-type cytochrome subunit [Campylobacter sp.]
MYEEIDMLKRTPEYEFSVGLRLTHWIRALCIVVLVITGYYISYVFIAPSVSSEPNLFLQAKWRFVHLVAGFVLIAATIFKLYLFLFDKKSRKELVSIKDFLSPKVWIAQIKYYLFLGEHPHLRGVYNPLQFIAYIGFYFVLFLICLTGMILYVHIYHDGLGGFFYEILRPVEAMLGGLSEVRIIHHI